MNHPLTTVSSVFFALTGVFLMFIILLQRGRGGGLAGAFGGAGGQSAFGTKAGDVFTRITIGVAIFWIVMAALTSFAMRHESGGRFESKADRPSPGDVEPVPKGAANMDDFEGTTGEPAKSGKGAPSATPKSGEASKQSPAKSPPAKSSGATGKAPTDAGTGAKAPQGK